MEQNNWQEPCKGSSSSAQKALTRGKVKATLIDHTYYDYSTQTYTELLAKAQAHHDEGSAHNNASPSKSGSACKDMKITCRTLFPTKLHKMLSNPEYHDIIRWMPHGRSWKIFDSKGLESCFEANNFKHRDFNSLIRSVNDWGFKRLHGAGPDFKSYYHELFLRDNPEIAKMMRRLINPGRRLPNPKGEPNFYEISKDYPLPPHPNAKDKDEREEVKGQELTSHPSKEGRTSYPVHVSTSQAWYKSRPIQFSSTSNPEPNHQHYEIRCPDPNGKMLPYRNASYPVSNTNKTSGSFAAHTSLTQPSTSYYGHHYNTYLSQERLPQPTPYDHNQFVFPQPHPYDCQFPQSAHCTPQNEYYIPEPNRQAAKMYRLPIRLNAKNDESEKMKDRELTSRPKNEDRASYPVHVPKYQAWYGPRPIQFSSPSNPEPNRRHYEIRCRDSNGKMLPYRNASYPVSNTNEATGSFATNSSSTQPSMSYYGHHYNTYQSRERLPQPTPLSVSPRPHPYDSQCPQSAHCTPQNECCIPKPHRQAAGFGEVSSKSKTHHPRHQSGNFCNMFDPTNQTLQYSVSNEPTYLNINKFGTHLAIASEASNSLEYKGTMPLKSCATTAATFNVSVQEGESVYSDHSDVSDERNLGPVMTHFEFSDGRDLDSEGNGSLSLEHAVEVLMEYLGEGSQCTTFVQQDPFEPKETEEANEGPKELRKVLPLPITAIISKAMQPTKSMG